MPLSNDLISQFVKATNDTPQTKKEDTVKGSTIEYNGTIFVRLDGSDRLTPITSTADVKPGERVIVSIKNHEATVIGNVTSPSASSTDMKEAMDQITEFELIIAYRVTTEDLAATTATIEDLKAKVAKFENMEAVNAIITELETEYAKLDYVTATDVDALNAIIQNLEAEFGKFTDISTEDFEAINASIQQLRGYNADFTYVSADRLSAIQAEIKKLDVNKLSAEQADLKYANIDFTNINEAAVIKIFSESGIIRDLIVSEGKITGELVGVTIKGDIIEGGTVKADKLVVKGSDGLFYKLNTDGVDITAEQTEYNSLNGSVITAKSITAEKVAVDDLVAFDATIGGFSIGQHAIYSGVKSSIDNTTRGIFLGDDGQIAFGDSDNYIKYFKDADGNYKLAISAKSITLSSSNKNVEEVIGDAIVSSVEEFYQSTSPISLNGGAWSTTQPTWVDGKYIWRRTAITYGDGSSEYSPSNTGVCITGNTGAKGDDAVLLQIISSNGQMFKNSSVSTTLAVNIIVGGTLIASSREMYDYFGNGAYLIWLQKKLGETSFSQVDTNDSRISDNGFLFTINSEDVSLQTVYNCEFYY